MSLSVHAAAVQRISSIPLATDTPADPLLGTWAEPRFQEQPVPAPRREWVIAAIIGAVIALAGAVAIVVVEAYRFPPPPSAEEGAKEYGIPRPKPTKSDPFVYESSDADAPLIDIPAEDEEPEQDMDEELAPIGSATNSDVPP